MTEEKGLQVRVSGLQQVMTVQDIKLRKRQIDELVASAMQEGVHYGTMPGIAKPFLMKAGAEMLCAMFGLRDDYELDEERHEPGYIFYRVKCTLRTAHGLVVSSKFASCSSKEKKYRYRWEHVADVPEGYWEARKRADSSGQARIVREAAKSLGLAADEALDVKKVDGQWGLCRRIENDEPEDLDHTLLSMAQKRALVAAVRTALGISDKFHDIEPPPRGLPMDDEPPDEAKVQRTRYKKKPAESLFALELSKEQQERAAKIEQLFSDHGVGKDKGYAALSRRLNKSIGPGNVTDDDITKAAEYLAASKE